MLISENVARAKWCPMVRIDNNNRLHNSLTDGFQNSEKMYHCIAVTAWAGGNNHLSHLKGSEEGLHAHGYCGYAGKGGRVVRRPWGWRKSRWLRPCRRHGMNISAAVWVEHRMRASRGPMSHDLIAENRTSALPFGLVDESSTSSDHGADASKSRALKWRHRRRAIASARNARDRRLPAIELGAAMQRAFTAAG